MAERQKPMTRNFEGQVVLLTGASGGVGVATARYFHDRGALLALLDRDEAALGALSADLGSCFHQVCDVSDEASMAGAIRAVADAHHGRIDVGILNAAISGHRTPIQKTGSVANMGHGRAASPSWGIRQHWRNAY